MYTIDIGVACSKSQRPDWWGQLVRIAIRLERNPMLQVGACHFVGSALTDFNRNEIVKAFLAGDSDALWQIDDDTVPKPDAILDLIRVQGDIVNGVYFLRSGEHNPVAYQRHPRGKYMFLGNARRGEVSEVDSVGMGNTLVWRRVFETIQEQYLVYKHTYRGTYYPIHRDDVTSWNDVRVPDWVHDMAPVIAQGPGRTAYEVRPLEGPLDPRQEDFTWPFYGLEVGRTEDHWFCEMARRCGFTILADTHNEALHIGQGEVSFADWQRTREELLRRMELKNVTKVEVTE